MEQEKELTGQESLELISRMINKARRDYYDTGLSSLLWGSTITFCSLVSILAVFTPFPYVILYLAASAQLAWFIPGLILRKRYLKANKENV